MGETAWLWESGKKIGLAVDDFSSSLGPSRLALFGSWWEGSLLILLISREKLPDAFRLSLSFLWSLLSFSSIMFVFWKAPPSEE